MRSRSPRAAQHASDAPQMRGPAFFAVNRGPGSAAHRFTLRCARDTSLFRPGSESEVGGKPREPRQPLFAGVNCTDSPQPQAEVWFGLLNTNCAESFSVL